MQILMEYCENLEEKTHLGEHWQEHDLIFSSAMGTSMNPSNLQ